MAVVGSRLQVDVLVWCHEVVVGRLGVERRYCTSISLFYSADPQLGQLVLRPVPSVSSSSLTDGDVCDRTPFDVPDFHRQAWPNCFWSGNDCTDDPDRGYREFRLLQPANHRVGHSTVQRSDLEQNRKMDSAEAEVVSTSEPNRPGGPC